MKLDRITFISILLLSVFGIYCSLIIGISWDEPFANINALSKINFLKSFGKNLDYLKYEEFHNPGFYEVILAFLSNLFHAFWVFEVRHLLNLVLSFFTLFGVFLLVKENFNKKIGLFTVLLCLLNPFFFGMMSITVRDMPVCFAYVWSIYLISKYIKNFFDNNTKITIALGLIIGFGLGSRLGFVINIFPILLILIYFLLIYKNQIQVKYFLIKILKDSSIIIFLSLIILFSFWINAYESPFHILIDTFKQTMNLTKGPETFIINGNIYNTIDTPRNYLPLFLLLRFPLFIIMLTLLFLITLIIEKDFFLEKYELFNSKIFFNFLIILFPFSLIIIMKVTIYDDFRLFIFLIPFISLFPALGLDFLIDNLKKNAIYKITLFLVLATFIIFFERFVRLTPYQYDYSNYLQINYSNTENLYQHDYWATSYKELVKKIKNNEKFSNKKFSVSVCGGNLNQIINEFIKDKNFRQNVTYYPKIAAHEADYIIMINRLGSGKFKNEKCFNRFKGADINSVNRLGINYSVFRKIKLDY